ncbi:lipase member H-A isoform X2 [Drosophila santomea]|uniref:lipase member H-A isoform X2 n=1 Tax=Drosophila santomea TaxID=129105 RepID=UPI0019549188|nr:lipase member H-A isoform X2 [Drosophila santomea]
MWITLDMAKTSLCLVPILCQFLGLQAALLDSLLNQSTIYYLKSSGDVALENVDQLASVESVKLIVHGYLGSRTHGSIMPLRNAYTAQGYENVLVADWGPVANLDYPSSRLAVKKVSSILAKLLEEFLQRHGVNLERVHVIGHSLGAHIAGGIGRYFKGSLGRVTGLDPALPLFSSRSDDSLHSNAALFVDVIHTDYPLFGDIRPRGTVDFYPNFGLAPQPGCENVDVVAANSCSHNRAVMFFAESVGMPENFPAISCSLAAIKSRRVEDCLREKSKASTGNANEYQTVFMGEHVNRSATLYYYLETNGAPPYGQGRNSHF